VIVRVDVAEPFTGTLRIDGFRPETWIPIGTIRTIVTCPPNPPKDEAVIGMSFPDADFNSQTRLLAFSLKLGVADQRFVSVSLTEPEPFA